MARRNMRRTNRRRTNRRNKVMKGGEGQYVTWQELKDVLTGIYQMKDWLGYIIVDGKIERNSSEALIGPPPSTWNDAQVAERTVGGDPLLNTPHDTPGWKNLLTTPATVAGGAVAAVAAAPPPATTRRPAGTYQRRSEVGGAAGPNTMGSRHSGGGGPGKNTL